MLKKIYFRLLGLLAVYKIKQAKSFSGLCDSFSYKKSSIGISSVSKTRYFIFLSVCAYRCFQQRDSRNGNKVFIELVKNEMLLNIIPVYRAFLMEAGIWENNSTEDVCLEINFQGFSDLERKKFKFIESYFKSSNINHQHFEEDISKIEMSFFITNLKHKCLKNYYESTDKENM